MRHGRTDRRMGGWKSLDEKWIELIVEVERYLYPAVEA
jgi:hypothetical protein